MVTGVKYREAMIAPAWRKRIQEFVEGVLRSAGQLPLALYAMPDHIHVFAALHPTVAVADCVGQWKSNSSRFIRDTFGVPFEWQRGYGAFAISRRAWPAVIGYVNDQERRHAAETFRGEYRTLLRENEVDFEERYLFDDLHAG